MMISLLLISSLKMLTREIKHPLILLKGIGTDNVAEISKIIIKKGEIQLTTEQEKQ